MRGLNSVTQKMSFSNGLFTGRERKETICSTTRTIFYLTTLYFLFHLRHLPHDEPRLCWQTGTSRESKDPVPHSGHDGA